jgi:hypothetical protein
MEGIVVATRQPQPHVGWHLDSCWDLGHGRNFRDETTSPDCGRIGVGLPRSIRECRHTSVLLHTGRPHSLLYSKKATSTCQARNILYSAFISAHLLFLTEFLNTARQEYQ